ncbi:MAG TPA: prohibitin family protein [Clostridia bacterium]|nr:prohibitin family protein [Clostridia bacterium]
MFKRKDGTYSIGKIFVSLVAAALVLGVVFGSFIVIPAGHTGVVVTFGSVSENVLQEGIHLKIPFAQSVVQIDNRIVKLEVSTEAFSKDLQTITTVLAVNYRISKSMSYSIYKEVGGGFEDVLVIPAVNEVLKAVVAKYTASDLVGNRSAVSAELDAQLDEKLNSRGIFVEDFNIIDWDFSTEYIAAVEAKQVAEQNLIKTRTEQEQQTVIAEAEAERQVITANAAAQSALIAAEAEAKRIVMEAEAQAEANQKLAASLNESVIEYLKIQRWNGVLPYVTGEASPFVDISSMVE